VLIHELAGRCALLLGQAELIGKLEHVHRPGELVELGRLCVTHAGTGQVVG
jgi:hypothetical protein